MAAARAPVVRAAATPAPMAIRRLICRTVCRLVLFMVSSCSAAAFSRAARCSFSSGVKEMGGKECLKSSMVTNLQFHPQAFSGPAQPLPGGGVGAAAHPGGLLQAVALAVKQIH